MTVTRDGGLALVERAGEGGGRTAIVGPAGAFTYRELLRASEEIAHRLLAERSSDDLAEERVACLVPSGFAYVAAQWGVWRAGGIAVPLALSHPEPELAHALDDSFPTALLVHPSLDVRIESLAAARDIPVLLVDDGDGWSPSTSEGPPRPLPSVSEDRGSLMLYTSGTTGRPKGVVHTHRSVRAQVEALEEAWGWRSDDRILLVLPLHHVHGIVNVVTCALWSNACCVVPEAFDPADSWHRIGSGDLTLFMAVPTIYHKLVQTWESASPSTRRAWSDGARSLRLMVSGSAALPVPVLERWHEITGHTLLERYGMTEIGMALSNPLEGERRPGFVGRPLPGVGIRLVDDGGRTVEEDGQEGEILVRGPSLFREYWRRPEASRNAFTDDGWFRTGDIALRDDGSYRILGRRSVDIIKSGGFKISALEVESVLREHPEIDDCAVVGIPDPEWGERVAAAFVPARNLEDGEPEPRALRRWAKKRLASYKAPTLFRSVPALPRNAMGKVTKPEVRTLFQDGP